MPRELEGRVLEWEESELPGREGGYAAEFCGKSSYCAPLPENDCERNSETFLEKDFVARAGAAKNCPCGERRGGTELFSSWLCIASRSTGEVG